MAVAATTSAVVIRHDVEDQLYKDLASQTQYACVGRIDSTEDDDSFIASGVYIGAHNGSAWLLTASHNLTHIGWRVLALLHDVGEGGAIPVGQLARDVLAKQPTVTKLVQRMADDGLVRLCADPQDQRRTLVAPTREGRRVAGALIAEARTREATHLAHRSASEVDTLKRMLQRLAAEG